MDPPAIFGRDDDTTGASPMKDDSMGVIWKESPVEKKLLQPSGASNAHANASELRGFVNSLITSPSPNKHQSSKLKFKKKVVPDGVSRHIAFSPDRRDEPRTRPPTVPVPSPQAQAKRHKSGDEDQHLLSILQQMDDAYSDSPEKLGSVIPPAAPLTSTAQSRPPAPTATPIHIPASTAVPKAPPAVPTPAPPPALDDDLTDEAWDLLEQIEIQATQQHMERQREQSARVEESPAEAPRVKERAGISPAVVAKAPVARLFPPAAKPRPTDYLRFVALEVHVDHNARRLQLRAMDEDTAMHDVVLAEDWFDTPIAVGDTFNFIFTVQPPGPLIATNAQHLVIVHPDILVSPTNVTASLQCARLAMLQKSLSLNQPSGPKALVGTLKHDLFERALNSGYHSIPYLVEQSQCIIQASLLKCLESGLTETQAAEEMRASFQDMSAWLSKLHAAGVVAGSSTLRLHDVLATEEPLWSIKYGLKGAVDASVRLVRNGRPALLPLELKTGQKKFGFQDHQGQVLLYSLLLEERYGACAEGLLLYLLGPETILVPRVAPIVRALLQARNRHAVHVATYETTSAYPPLLRRPRDCGYCFSAAECMLHHASEEKGTAATSGVHELFLQHTAHLTAAEQAYFAKWNRLLDVEFRASQTAVQQLWRQTDAARVEAGTCIAGLALANVTPTTLQVTAAMAFSARDLKLQVDDRIIVSAESATATLLHVAKGKITALRADAVDIALFAPIPRAVLKGDSVVGAQPHWRIDKDTLSSGLHQAKRNLTMLFVGPSPAGITAGLHPSRPRTEREDELGDPKRRRLICRLEAPRFDHSRSTLALLEAHAAAHPTAPPFAPLYASFLAMNPDQQRAIENVLHAKDYALILGMPGTGKTSAITMCVRLLLHLGFSVLVTSYTHSAVDTLLLKLLDFNIPMLRVGAKEQVHARLQPHLLEARVRSLSTTAAIEAELTGAQLVGSTCLSTNHVLFAKRRFDYCIVDEASQITQPVLLGALRSADTFCLVGDHYQLPPLVTALKAKAGGLDVSLFKRLGEAHPSATVQLSFQYRMHRDIMLLCNALVYNHQLQCGDTRRPPWPLAAVAVAPWLQRVVAANVVFVDTDASGFHEERGAKGLVNPVEADAVGQIVRALRQAGAADVGVLSPFRAQVQLLEAQQAGVEVGSKHQRWLSGSVSTIDKYQGRDKDVVVVSFVRSNARAIVGELLLDWRRINVALTRARHKLVLVGSPTTLAGSPVLKALVDLVAAQRWVVPLPAGGVTGYCARPPVDDAPRGAKRVFVHVGADEGDIEGPAAPRRATVRPCPPVSRNILDESLGR
ncbi:hypothetical protein ACHHYP_04055 [Achlya hypogyna]|uniref:DNA replication ATP-dependent helicase/nuclease n=1 Tax=Achlya hypogyna TaxID=1202772 RepID=A0A1V9Z2Q9_ACHHY|nr:hypothetical protein ACHHYP_04055 [Achlya hypogyna]